MDCAVSLDWDQSDLPVRKHQVFQYGQNWYGVCGVCVRSVWNPRWSAAFNLLEYHVKDQHLTIAASSS